MKDKTEQKHEPNRLIWWLSIAAFVIALAKLTYDIIT